MSFTHTSEDQMYWQKWIDSRDSHAGDMLIRKYMPLVTYHVLRISIGLPKNISKDELKSFGMMGLYDSLKKFDPTRDLKFDTYASFRIRGAILDGLRKEDWLPRSTREKVKKIEVAKEKLEQIYLRSVTAKEVADDLGITEEEVYLASNEYFFANIFSIDDHLKDDDDRENLAFAVKDDKQISPEDEILKQGLHKQLAEVVQELNEKEQLVISLFYKEELTLTEIGHVMGLSTSRISQIHSKALFKLKDILAKVTL